MLDARGGSRVPTQANRTVRAALADGRASSRRRVGMRGVVHRGNTLEQVVAISRTSAAADLPVPVVVPDESEEPMCH
jgi:hypothetical protein